MRLQEHKKEATTSNNNNNTEEQSGSPSPTSSTAGEENEKQCLDNVTFEIVDSRIPMDEHVHVRSEDNSPAKPGHDQALSIQTSDSEYVPDSTTEAKVQEKPDSEVEANLWRVLRELNHGDSSTGECTIG